MRNSVSAITGSPYKCQAGAGSGVPTPCHTASWTPHFTCCDTLSGKAAIPLQQRANFSEILPLHLLLPETPGGSAPTPHGRQPLHRNKGLGYLAGAENREENMESTLTQIHNITPTLSPPLFPGQLHSHRIEIPCRHSCIPGPRTIRSLSTYNVELLGRRK